MKRLYRRYEGGSNHFAVIISVIVILMAAVATAAGQRMVGHIRTGVRRTTIQVISELTDNKVMMLNGVLGETESDVEVLSEYLGSMNEWDDSRELLERFKNNHNAEAVIILDAQGRYLYGDEHLLPDKILKSLRGEMDRSRGGHIGCASSQWRKAVYSVWSKDSGRRERLCCDSGGGAAAGIR